MTKLLDFKAMSKLAQDDPQQLEAWLQEEVERLINSAPPHHQHRLRGLQFTIDMERRKANNPMAACIRLSQLMHESFSKLRETLDQVQRANLELETQESAKIIPFAKES